MKDTRKKELREKLVDLRRVSSVDTKTHRRISEGQLVQLTRSMYFCAETWKHLKEYEKAFLRCYAAGCQSRKAVLVDCSAARLNGVRTIARSEPVTLAVPNGRPASTNNSWTGYEYRHRQIPEADIIYDGPVRYTDAIRTAVDIARERGVREGVIAIDSVLSGHGDQLYQQLLHQFRTTIARLAGTKGIANARKALPLASRLSDSPYESLLRLILDAHGVPYRTQAAIGRYRVDFLIGDNLVAEVDGWEKYENFPHEVLRKQRVRDDWLAERGYKVLHLYIEDFWGDEADLIQRIRNAWPGARSLLPVQVKPKGYTPTGPGRAVALPPDLQEAVDMLSRP